MKEHALRFFTTFLLLSVFVAVYVFGYIVQQINLLLFMSQQALNAEFWNKLYSSNLAKWDLGFVSPPIKKYIDKQKDKDMRILMPGAGNGYEVEYLFERGFSKVSLLDYSQLAIRNFQRRMPSFPKEQVFADDFFKHEGTYDIIFENNFFSAIHPNQRKEYVQRMHHLLADGGKLVGLVFNEKFAPKGPPFGATKKKYFELFEPYFDLKHFETAESSVESRLGYEFFFEMVRK